MKKIIAISAALSILSFASFASALDTSDWYQYSGESSIHSYNLSFPTDWKVKEIGDDLAGFAPQDNNEDIFSTVEEFEGLTYKQAINSKVQNGTTLINQYDFILSNGDSLVGKRAIYSDSEQTYEFSFFKWGSLILAINHISDEEQEIVQAIHNSLEFDDAWHQYIDYSDGYSFIFPSNSSIETIDNGVRILANNQIDQVVFEVVKYENSTAANAAKNAGGNDADLKSTEEINFHGVDVAIRASYEQDGTANPFNKIILEKNGDAYALVDENVMSNFPHADFYDQYIAESLESFEFFDPDAKIVTATQSTNTETSESGEYENFSDVGVSHPNAVAIDSLKSQGVIDGYQDGTFKPNGQINRAEITKLIVATVADPKASSYSNCFPDVSDQWFAPYVCYAESKGWVEGYSDGNFRPDSPVNRVEAIKIVLEVLLPENVKSAKIPKAKSNVTDVSKTEWYSKYFFFAHSNKLLDLQHISSSGDTFSYFPSGNMTRKEVAEMIYRSMNL